MYGFVLRCDQQPGLWIGKRTRKNVSFVDFPKFQTAPTRKVMRSRLVERDWAIRDVYLQRFAVTALPRQ